MKEMMMHAAVVVDDFFSGLLAMRREAQAGRIQNKNK